MTINQYAAYEDQECTAQRQPDVQKAMDRLARLIEGLSGISYTVSDRLNEVMRPEPPIDPKGSGTIKPIGTPLAGRIDVLCDQIESSMNTLGNVINRLEI